MGAFSLSEEPLDAQALAGALHDPRAGALVTFEGWVRNTNEGRAVLSLEYEAYRPLALAEGGRILEEARARFSLVDALCAHRVGHLAVADMAVWVGVVAGHRAEAFAACKFIIDEVKHRVPLWKKEHYADGDAEWVGIAGSAHRQT